MPLRETHLAAPGRYNRVNQAYRRRVPVPARQSAGLPGVARHCLSAQRRSMGTWLPAPPSLCQARFPYQYPRAPTRSAGNGQGGCQSPLLVLPRPAPPARLATRRAIPAPAGPAARHRDWRETRRLHRRDQDARSGPRAGPRWSFCLSPSVPRPSGQAIRTAIPLSADLSSGACRYSSCRHNITFPDHEYRFPAALNTVFPQS